MNKSQLNFVMDNLGFTGERREAVQAIICRDVSAYAAEKMYNITKGTASRDSIKCAELWGKMLDTSKSVDELLGKQVKK